MFRSSMLTVVTVNHEEAAFRLWFQRCRGRRGRQWPGAGRRVAGVDGAIAPAKAGVSSCLRSRARTRCTVEGATPAAAAACPDRGGRVFCYQPGPPTFARPTCQPDVAFHPDRS